LRTKYELTARERQREGFVLDGRDRRGTAVGASSIANG
jgi:hypothetical protein